MSLSGIKTIQGKDGATQSIQIDVKKCDPSIIDILVKKGVELKHAYKNRKFLKKLNQAKEQIRRGEYITLNSPDELWEHIK